MSTILRTVVPPLNYADFDILITIRFATAAGAYPLALCKIESDDQDRLINIHPRVSLWLSDHKSILPEILFIPPIVESQHKNPHYIQAAIHYRRCRLGLID